MAAIADLTESEKYLVALLQDQSGIDAAELCWSDETAQDSVFRCWDFQYSMYRNTEKFQVDLCGRSLGKSLGIQMRAFAFPFTSADQEMLITAPEMIHLDPVTKKVEDRITSVRIGREYLKTGSGVTGFTHRPFEARFRNGARIIGRIPQKDGRGVKGCIAAGALVLTERGQIPIEDVLIGDMVLTHRGRWRRVTANFRYTNVDGFVIKGGGHRGLVTSNNHRMLGRRNSNPQRTRNLGREHWIIVDDPELTERYYFGSPTEIPSVALPDDLPHPDVEALLQLAGAYVADGNQGDGRRIEITDGVDQVDRLTGYATVLGLGFGVYDKAPGSRARRITVYGTAVAAWLLRHFGQHANAKHLPVWLLGADEGHRKAFLDAYLQGDGHWSASRGRWEVGTASKALAIDLRLLGQSLGYRANYSWVDPKPNAFCAKPQRSHRVQLSMTNRNVLIEDGAAWQKVCTITPADVPVVHDLTVEDDHSYLADGLFSHNQHPKKLEMDEAQDYPEPGWVELGETLKYADEDATWRAHGVSRGVRDRYYKQTQPESGWFVHRYCLPAGTLIYGVDGPFEIQDAIPGTLVWSVAPDGSMEQQPVLARVENGEKATWFVATKGGYSLESTGNHPYLVLDRSGTRRTRNTLAFEWVEAQDLVPGDYVIGVRELESTGVQMPTPDQITTMLADHSPVREVPAWVWAGPRALQLGFLSGYLMGDGSLSRQVRGQDPWQVSTTSPRMGKQLRALCHYLGLRCTRLTASTAKRGFDGIGTVYRFYVYASESWFDQVPHAYSNVRDGRCLEGLDKRLVARRVELSEPTGHVVPTYDITVDEHHNYVAEGMVVHNTAMHRADWTPQERAAKAELYGSRDHPDYRRNILGAHGDASSALFVLTRLMACVDQDQNSQYNTAEYTHIRIDDDKLRDRGIPIDAMLDFPASHQTYGRTWVGMDVGMCADEQTEILTQRGWLTLDDVRSGDRTLSIDESDGRSYWTDIDEVHIFDDSGAGSTEWDMVAMRGQSFDALVTPRHRWLIRDYAGKLAWKTTMQLTSKDQVPCAVERGDMPAGPTYKHDLVKLAAWYFTEGSVNNKGSISICQSLANSLYVDMIRNILVRLYGESGAVTPGPGRAGGPLWSEKHRVGARTGHLRDDDEMVYFYLSATIRDELAALVAGRERVPTPEFLGSLTESQLRVFLLICGLGDGWLQAGRQLFQQSSEPRARAYEYACSLLGVAVSTKRYTRTQTNVCSQEHDYWHTGMLNRGVVAPVGAAMQARRTGAKQSMTVEKVRYEGRVWCPTLSRGNWLARRNGSIYFTGNTNHPSEIIVLGEDIRQSSGGKRADGVPDMRLRTLARIHLERISSRDQRLAMGKICDFYRPVAFSMDKTGIGLPIWSEIMEGDNSLLAMAMRGYNFSEKIPVGYLPQDEDAPYDPENPDGEPIMANVLEYSSDMLRTIVDQRSLVLPWDIDMLREFQGQTYVVVKSTTDHYGKKMFNKGKFHALDAFRMAVLGYKQEHIDAMRALSAHTFEPVFDEFLV